MKLYAPTHEPVHVALLNGHATLITKEGTEVDKQFFRDAMDKGCLTEPADKDSKSDAEDDAENDIDDERKQAIKNAINDMLNGSNEGDFNADGKPDLRKLKDRVGFKVSKAESDAVLAELV